MNFKKLFFTLFVFMFVQSGIAFASGSTDIGENNSSDRKEPVYADIPVFTVYEGFDSDMDTVGGLLFLFSSAKLSHKHEGYVISLFSDVLINGDFSGDMYSFFSSIRVNNASNVTITTFSSDVSVDQMVLGNVRIDLFLKIFRFFVINKTENGLFIYSDRIPVIVIQCLLIVLNVFICSIIFNIKKSFMEQGSILINEEPLEVIKYGVIAFAILLGAIITTALTIFLIPLALCIFLGLYLLVLIGEVALSTFVGFLIFDAAKIKLGSFTYMLCGVVILEVIKIVPVIGWGVSYLFLPILSLGIVVATLVNGFVKKIFYETPYSPPPSKKEVDIHRKRDIILGRN